MDLRDNFLTFIPLLLSLSVHEWAHAISAYYLGDDTAARQGRLTLNPLAHIDPIGTLLLPLMGVRFGWAKPVPVDPTRFRSKVSMTTGMMITAAAGPISNLILAFLCILALAIALKVQPDLLIQHEAIYTLLQRGAGINIGLAVFNALPIPPLDGSRIAEALVPYRHRDTWASFARVAPILLLVLIVFPGRLSFIDGPMNFVEGTIVRTAMWMVGLS